MTQPSRTLSMNTNSEGIILTNEFNQPIGVPVLNWNGAQYPDNSSPLVGDYVYLEKLDMDVHVDDLWEVFCDTPESYYTYLFHGPIRSRDEMKELISTLSNSKAFVYYAIMDKTTKKAIGYINLMRIDPQHGSIEVGCVCFSHKLQKNRMGTEVIFLLMRYSFEQLGYRRFEWKCDANNIPSRNAALRFGFNFEGLFRKNVVYRGRTRDTTWFSILDTEFNAIMKPAYTQYLHESNFDENNVQLQSLPSFILPLREKFDALESQNKAEYYAITSDLKTVDQNTNETVAAMVQMNTDAKAGKFTPYHYNP